MATFSLILHVLFFPFLNNCPCYFQPDSFLMSQLSILTDFLPDLDGLLDARLDAALDGPEEAVDGRGRRRRRPLRLLGLFLRGGGGGGLAGAGRDGLLLALHDSCTMAPRKLFFYSRNMIAPPLLFSISATAIRYYCCFLQSVPFPFMALAGRSVGRSVDLAPVYELLLALPPSPFPPFFLSFVSSDVTRPIWLLPSFPFLGFGRFVQGKKVKWLVCVHQAPEGKKEGNDCCLPRSPQHRGMSAVFYEGWDGPWVTAPLLMACRLRRTRTSSSGCFKTTKTILPAVCPSPGKPFVCSFFSPVPRSSLSFFPSLF